MPLRTLLYMNTDPEPQIASLLSANAALESDHQRVSTELTETYAKSAALVAEVESLQATIRTYRPAVNECIDLRAKVTTLSAELAEAKRERERFERLYESLNKTLDRVSGEAFAANLEVVTLTQRNEGLEAALRNLMEHIGRKNYALREALGFVQMTGPEDSDDNETMAKIEALSGNITAALRKTYLFFRDSGFYPVELEDDYSARENAELNPGTIRVENAETREVVWSAALTPPTGGSQA